jgi:sugar phosphate isomerase/epimerase
VTIDPSKARVFREELAELYERYGLKITSCGCCNEWIEPCASWERGADVARSMAVREGDREVAPIIPGIPAPHDE